MIINDPIMEKKIVKITYLKWVTATRCISRSIEKLKVTCVRSLLSKMCLWEKYKHPCKTNRFFVSRKIQLSGHFYLRRHVNSAEKWEILSQKIHKSKINTCKFHPEFIQIQNGY